MGFYNRVTDSNFRIDGKNEAKAFSLLKDFVRSANHDFEGDRDQILATKTLCDALVFMGVELEEDYSECKTKCGLDWGWLLFEADYTADLFSAIAPAVNAGSFILFGDENGKIWRWVFDRERMVEQDCEVVWKTDGGDI